MRHALPPPHLLSPPSPLLLTSVRKARAVNETGVDTHTQTCTNSLPGISSFLRLAQLPDCAHGIRLKTTYFTFISLHYLSFFRSLLSPLVHTHLHLSSSYLFLSVVRLFCFPLFLSYMPFLSFCAHKILISAFPLSHPLFSCSHCFATLYRLFSAELKLCYIFLL